MGEIVALYENSWGTGGRTLANQRSSSVDLIITSPPYLGAQKYVRATSLTLGWLSLVPSTKLRKLEDLSIGREHFRKRDYSEPLCCGLEEVDRLLEEVREI